MSRLRIFIVVQLAKIVINILKLPQIYKAPFLQNAIAWFRLISFFKS